MATTRQRRSVERGRHELVRLTERGLGRREFMRQAGDLLRAVVPYDGACWHTMDPATRLITSHETNLSGEGFPFVLRHEYVVGGDVATFASLAGGRPPVAVLSAATRGRPERSPRFRDLYRPRGWGAEARATFDAAGVTWGSVMLLREAGSPDFGADEAASLAALSRHLAHGVRTAILADADGGAAADVATNERHGLVLLSADDEVETVAPGAHAWLDELGADGALRNLPSSVLACAGRARALARDGIGPPARAVTVTAAGRWVTLHGLALGDPPDGRAAVVIEPARRAEVAPLLVAAYGLTEREREVLGAVLQGLSAKQVAARLVVSPHTVNDHLKAIYEKTGARGRSELAGRLFYDHYAPRVDGPLGADGFFA